MHQVRVPTAVGVWEPRMFRSNQWTRPLRVMGELGEGSICCPSPSVSHVSRVTCHLSFVRAPPSALNGALSPFSLSFAYPFFFLSFFHLLHIARVRLYLQESQVFWRKCFAFQQPIGCRRRCETDESSNESDGFRKRICSGDDILQFGVGRSCVHNHVGGKLSERIENGNRAKLRHVKEA